MLFTPKTDIRGPLLFRSGNARRSVCIAALEPIDPGRAFAPAG
jgi:hypothetical protein